jgi:hypothetical protein
MVSFQLSLNAQFNRLVIFLLDAARG